MPEPIEFCDRHVGCKKDLFKAGKIWCRLCHWDIKKKTLTKAQRYGIKEEDYKIKSDFELVISASYNTYSNKENFDLSMAP